MGYAVYFQILELIAINLEKNNNEEWGYVPEEYTKETEFLADELGVPLEQFQSIFSTCLDLHLLEEKEDGRIYCAQILERVDEYTEKIVKQREKKETQSGVSRESVGTTSGIRREENRIEKKRIEKELEEKENKPALVKKKSSLNSIFDQDIEEIAEAYHVPVAFVRSKLDDLRNYCESKGKQYKDYKATLRNWVKEDALERRENAAKGNQRIKYVGDPL